MTNLIEYSDRIYKADYGKVFKRIDTDTIIGDWIDLGDDDSVENYEEIDENEASKINK